jgi:hypothetical protein
MSPAIPLREVPGTLLDQDKWTQIRSLTSNELEAICSLNAPYPVDGAEFFWRGEGSGADARRCYRIGKSMLEDCRSRFISGELVAIAEARNGVQQLIPKVWWIDLYPMFATDSVKGRTRHFQNVKVYEGDVASPERVLNECIAWMKMRKFGGVNVKKLLYREAFDIFGDALTSRMFENSYKVVFNRRRGRPYK